MAAQGLSWGIMGEEAAETLWDLRWMLVLVLVLVGADFRFGLKESRVRFEKAREHGDHLAMDKYRFHFSRAGRRTLNKAVDYLTYLLLGAVLGLAVLEPYGIGHVYSAAALLGMAAAFEMSSILGHILYCNGIDTPRISGKSLWHFALRFAAKWLKRKDADAGGALEETINEDKGLKG